MIRNLWKVLRGLIRKHVSDSIVTARYHWVYRSPVSNPTLLEKFNAWLDYTDQSETAVQVEDYIVSRSNSYIRVYEHTPNEEERVWTLVSEEHYPGCTSTAFRRITETPQNVERFCNSITFPDISTN